MTAVEGNLKAPFSIAAIPFPGLLHFTLDPYLIMLAASSTIFLVFGVTQSGIESCSPGPLPNTLLTRPMAYFFISLSDSIVADNKHLMYSIIDQSFIYFLSLSYATFFFLLRFHSSQLKSLICIGHTRFKHPFIYTVKHFLIKSWALVLIRSCFFTANNMKNLFENINMSSCSPSWKETTTYKCTI